MVLVLLTRNGRLSGGTGPLKQCCHNGGGPSFPHCLPHHRGGEEEGHGKRRLGDSHRAPTGAPFCPLRDLSASNPLLLLLDLTEASCRVKCFFPNMALNEVR